MNTVVCVLKSGLFKPWAAKDYTVQYGPQHVLWLRDQLAAKCQTPHRFVCMTDMEVPGVETLPLKDDLPGWWSKLELFREFDNAAYLDLDTVITGDVLPVLFQKRKFLISAHMTQRHGVNSSVMSWEGDYSHIYKTFIADKARVMKEFVFSKRWGDQDFIKETLIATQGPIVKFQHSSPDFILSYRHDVLHRNMPVRFGARRRVKLTNHWYYDPHIVNFHGSPKPYIVDLPWVPKLCAA